MEKEGDSIMSRTEWGKPEDPPRRIMTEETRQAIAEQSPEIATIPDYQVEQDIDMEQAFLGALLNDYKTGRAALEYVTSDHFMLPEHRRLYAILRDMEIAGIHIDERTLRDFATERGELKEIGGLPYVIDLGLIHAGNPGGMEYYARVLRKAYRKRMQQSLTHSLAKALHEGIDVTDLIRQYEEAMASMDRGLCTIKDSQDFRDLLTVINSGRYKSVIWPWSILSNLSRSLTPGAITIVVGSGGTSKSLFVQQACLYWQDQNTPFALFHLEEDRAFHLKRAFAQICEKSCLTDLVYLRDNADEVERLEYENRARLDDFSRSLWDAPDESQTHKQILDWIGMRAKEKRRVIVVDPMTAIKCVGRLWETEPDFLVQARRIIRKHGASLILVSHTRGGKTSKDDLDNIAGSRGIGRFASNVFTLSAIDSRMMPCKRSLGEIECRVNRVLKLTKLRDAPGMGASIGMNLDVDTLLIGEQGII